MVIHGLTLVKNEADIIAQCLTAALTWCDAIYVYDNGSTDGTWERILALSEDNTAIVPYRQDDTPFRDALRARIYNHYSHRGAPGDWWCRLDADEFYIDDPKEFLATVQAPYQTVISSSFQFYFTDKDVARYRRDPSLYADDVPVERKCRYYLKNWGELRFFRQVDGLVWRDGHDWPDGLGPAHPRRIRLKHFQYRSPEQIRKRLLTRREAIVKRVSFFHEGQLAWRESVLGIYALSPEDREYGFTENWEDRVLDASRLNYYPLEGEDAAG